MFNQIFSTIKAKIFKIKIKIYRKNKKSKVILNRGMSNLIISLLVLILHIGLILLFFTLIVSIVYGFLLLIDLLIDSENQSSNLTAIIVSIVGILGVMYSSSKARADKEQDRSDNSLFIILQ